jgi:hypothetical protein
MTFQTHLKNFLTTLLAVFLICICTLAQNNGIPSLVNFSSQIVEDVVDEVISQSVRVQRSVQYQKQRSETPDIKSVAAAPLYETSLFHLSDCRFFDENFRHYTVRGPPVTLI